MADWRDRVLKALLLPADDSKEPELLTLPLRELLQRADIKYLAQVRTHPAQENQFVMVIDDDGHDRRLPINPRAQYLSEYPVEHGIMGGALFFSEAWVDDGFDLVDLTDMGHDYLTAESKKHAYRDWLKANIHSLVVWGYVPQ